MSGARGNLPIRHTLGMTDSIRVSLIGSPSGVTESDVDVVDENVPAYVWLNSSTREVFHLDGRESTAGGKPVYVYQGTDELDPKLERS